MILVSIFHGRIFTRGRLLNNTYDIGDELLADDGRVEEVYRVLDVQRVVLGRVAAVDDQQLEKKIIKGSFKVVFIE
jgi:hypothetical protein